MLRTGTARTVGCDVYGVASRVCFTDVFVRGRNFPGDVWQPTVPTSGLEGGVAKRFVREGRVT